MLLERFNFKYFFGFANVIGPFIDRGFGHNFDPTADWDRSFIDRLHAIDEEGFKSGRLKPTQMLAVMTKAQVPEPVFVRDLAAEFCVRPIFSELWPNCIRRRLAIISLRCSIFTCWVRGCKNFCVNGHLAGNCRIQGAMMTVAKKAVPKELLDSLLADYRKPEDLIGENGLLKQLTKLLVEKALEAEMADHLGHGKNEPVENPAGNTRNPCRPDGLVPVIDRRPSTA